MKPQLFAHPFSAYCQKVLIALYENDTPFELRLLDQKTPEIVAEWSALWPLKRMPVLQEGDETVLEFDDHHRISGAQPSRARPPDP